MVCLQLFENSAKDQTIRTLIALVIIVISDLVYQFLLTHSLSKTWETIRKNILAYINVWITLAIVFGVSVIYTDQKEQQTKKIEINSESIKNHAFYGILIGLLVYVPLYNWLVGIGQITGIQSLCNTAFGVLIGSIACLCTFLVGVQTNLFD
jgi:uncharacterized membrane protein